MERRTIHFSGRVQGVGFRLTTQIMSRTRPVTGYVKNLPNGEVELIVEGSGAVLDEFLDALSAKMAHHITDTRVAVGPATGEFETFGIRYE